MPAWCGRETGLEVGDELLVAEHAEVGPRQPVEPGRRDLVDAGALVLVGEVEPGRHAGASGLLALGPAEDEVDRRQQVAVVQLLDRVDPAGRGEGALAAPLRIPVLATVAPEPHRARVEPQCVGVGPTVHDRRQQAELVVGDVVDVVEVVELHRPAILDHGTGGPADGLDPVGELDGVAHRRREAHQLHVVREVDDDLLPHGAPIRVLQVVHLVEHHHGEVVEFTLRVDHVAQHLGGHHHRRGVAVDRVVTGEQTDAGVTVDLGEVVELLVRERLDRSGVERPPPVAECRRDAVLGDHRLAAPCRRRDDHVLAGVERVDRLDLEAVEREVVASEDRLAVWPHSISLARVRRLRPDASGAGSTNRSGSRRSTGRSSAPTGRAARSGRPTG